MPLSDAVKSYKYSSGGQGQIDVFKLKLVGKEFSIVDSAGAAANDQSDAVLSLQLLENVKYSFNDDGSIKLAIGNVADDKPLSEFLEANRPANATTASLEELTLDTGVKIGGGSTGSYYLIIAYSGLLVAGTTEAPTYDIKTVAAIGQFSPTSGEWEQKSGSFSKPTVEFNGSPNSGTDLAIAAAFFESKILLTSAVTTAAPKITNGKSHWISFITKAEAVA